MDTKLNLSRFEVSELVNRKIGGILPITRQDPKDSRTPTIVAVRQTVELLMVKR